MSHSPRSSSNESDDWTLVTPPHSSSSSPSRLGINRGSQEKTDDELDELTVTRRKTTSTGQQTNPLEDCTNIVEEGISTENESQTQETGTHDEELVDIDLNDENSYSVQYQNKPQSTPSTQTVRLTKPSTALTTGLRCKSSGTQSDETSAKIAPTAKQALISRESNISSIVQRRSTDSRSKARDRAALSPYLSSSRGYSSPILRPSRLKNVSSPNDDLKVSCKPQRKKQNESISLYVAGATLVAIVGYIFAIIVRDWTISRYRLESFNLMETDVSEHAYVELKLMNEQINECIQRENPDLDEYVGRQDRYLPDTNPSPFVPYVRNKPYAGFVCYENEDEWRKRFKRLKRDFNLDYRNILRQARKRLTSDVLASYHPSLDFKLIQNQLEYIDYMDQARSKRKQEETIRHLVSENAKLRSQLREPNDSEALRAMTTLENENSKLKRDIETLRGNLAERTGTVYVRQSLELEHCERENNALKEFHHHISQDISKSLRKLNLHTIDASTIAHDDLGSLNSQLTITRGYLQRLTEELDSLINRNDALKDDLRFAYSLYSTFNDKIEGSESGFIGNHMLNAISSELPSVALSSVKPKSIDIRRRGENQSEPHAASLASEKALEDLATRLERDDSELSKMSSQLHMRQSELKERVSKSVDHLDSSCRASDDKNPSHSSCSTATQDSSYTRRISDNYRKTQDRNCIEKHYKRHQYNHNHHDHHHDKYAQRHESYKMKKYEKRTNHNRDAIQTAKYNQRHSNH